MANCFIRNHSRRAAVNLTLLTGTLVLLLAIAEGMLRFAGMADPIIYHPDPASGYEPKPSQSTIRLGVQISINDIGLRDNESREEILKEGGERILVLGDSVTYGGSRTPQPELFTEGLERRLRTAGHRVKVLNAGVNGYSVSQMVRRAPRLIREMDPQYLVLYLIRADFFRPPVQYLAEGNYIYPTQKPRSALADFVLLSVNHIDKRYPFLDRLPRWLTRIWEMPENSIPAFQENQVVETHLTRFDDFLRTVWEEHGRTRDDVLVFFSPYAADLEANLATLHAAELTKRLKALGIRSHDLRADLATRIAADDADVEDYYWDAVHFVENGHALAAEAMVPYVVRTWLEPETN